MACEADIMLTTAHACCPGTVAMGVAADVERSVALIAVVEVN